MKNDKCDKCQTELILCPQDWPWHPDYWQCPNCYSVYYFEEKHGGEK
jgi:hypothetical protein